MTDRVANLDARRAEKDSRSRAREIAANAGPHETICILSPAAEIAATLPVGFQKASGAERTTVRVGDSVLIEAQLCERYWVSARVLGADDGELWGLARNLEDSNGQPVVFKIPRDAVVAITKDH